MKRALAIAAIPLVAILAGCGSNASSSAPSSPSASVANSSGQPTKDVTITCTPDSSVNACNDEYTTSTSGGTAISILNPYEPETGSDMSSETFTLTIKPGNALKILGLKSFSSANGGTVSDLSPSSFPGGTSVTTDSATGIVTVHGALDFVGINNSGGIIYKGDAAASPSPSLPAQSAQTSPSAVAAPSQAPSPVQVQGPFSIAIVTDGPLTAEQQQQFGTTASDGIVIQVTNHDSDSADGPLSFDVDVKFYSDSTFVDGFSLSPQNLLSPGQSVTLEQDDSPQEGGLGRPWTDAVVTECDVVDTNGVIIAHYPVTQ